ncbi:unnamed protein product [Debaryomyces tyrocola]|nr:unnamed protein product [Debaryomyces tyrocola]
MFSCAERAEYRFGSILNTKILTIAEALIDDINLDIKIALEALSKESYIKAQDTL